MSRLGSFARYWIPVILWMALIFTASTDALSSSRTSRFIGPFLRWFHPGVSDLTIHRVQTVVRKGGHVTEYAVLSLLLWRALRGRPGHRRGGKVQSTRTCLRLDGAASPQSSEVRSCASLGAWGWRHAGVALLLAVLYAASDEWHQGFVPSRDGRATDVLWDAAGAVGGLAGLWAWGRWRKRW